MHIAIQNGRYILVCTFEERALARKSGFKWCAQTNQWFTTDWYKVFKWERTNNIDISKSVVPAKHLRFADSYRQESNGVCNNSRLKEFQKAGVEVLMFSPKFTLLADEPGLGKTIQCLEFFRVCNVKADRRFLVIPPATLKINWEIEAEAHAPGFFRIKILSGRMDTIEDPLTNLVIVNYDLLSSGIIFDGLKSYNADVLAADEEHMVKNPKAERTKRAFEIAEKTKRFIAISGTPIPNRPIEIFPLLAKFCPEALGDYRDQRRFEYHFCAGFEGDWGFDNSGASNLEELGERLRATCMIRRSKKNTVGEKKKAPKIFTFETDEETQKLVLKEKQLDRELLKKKKNLPVISELAELRQILALKKLPTCIEFLEDLLLSTQKVVIFAHHRAVLEALRVAFEKYNPVVIRGGMTNKAKQAAKEKFQQDKNCGVFIGQVKAAGVGITLTAANEVVFVESAWSPGDIEQCIDRCDRIGQDEWVNATFLVIEDSLEEHMLKIAFDKAVNIKKVMD